MASLKGKRTSTLRFQNSQLLFLVISNNSHDNKTTQIDRTEMSPNLLILSRILPKILVSIHLSLIMKLVNRFLPNQVRPNHSYWGKDLYSGGQRFSSLTVGVCKGESGLPSAQRATLLAFRTDSSGLSRASLWHWRNPKALTIGKLLT